MQVAFADFAHACVFHFIHAGEASSRHNKSLYADPPTVTDPRVEEGVEPRCAVQLFSDHMYPGTKETVDNEYLRRLRAAGQTPWRAGSKDDSSSAWAFMQNLLGDVRFALTALQHHYSLASYRSALFGALPRITSRDAVMATQVQAIAPLVAQRWQPSIRSVEGVC
jgi:hypothetical protein